MHGCGLPRWHLPESRSKRSFQRLATPSPFTILTPESLDWASELRRSKASAPPVIQYQFDVWRRENSAQRLRLVALPTMADLLPQAGVGGFAHALIHFEVPAGWHVVSAVPEDKEHRFSSNEPEKAVFLVTPAVQAKTVRVGSTDFTV